MPGRRLRTRALWTGTTLCERIAAAFVLSAWWYVVLQVPTPYGPYGYDLTGDVSERCPECGVQLCVDSSSR